jgi:transposase
MLKDSETPRYAVRRTKRTYSAETKAELLAACRAPGASIAAVASAHGMNANVLHRWLKESSQSRAPIGSGAGTRATAADIAGQRVPSFIALPLLTKPAEPVEREIKVEVRKGGLVMTVSWPMSAASEFACWSACVLK